MTTKMNEVRPESFLQGGMGYAGPSAQATDDLLHGQSWMSATPQDVVTSLAGIGQLAQVTAEPAVLDAIIMNAAEANAKLKMVNDARMKAAARDPIFAVKLKVAMQKTGAPGTNEAKAVIGAMNDAAKKATVAKQAERRARTLLAQGDRRGAAADAVVAMQTAREAVTLANKAEKTRLARSLDVVAKTLDAQADYVEGAVRQEQARSGRTARADALMASAQTLRAQAKLMRNQSAVVAQTPDVPPTAPTTQRIADVANRFNIRSSRHTVSRATLSVLGDLAEEPLAQASDYEGARMYYGNDLPGRLMADIEYGNVRDAIRGLSMGVNGLGYSDVSPTLARAEKMLQAGVLAAHEGYVNAVVPAFVGTERAVAARPAMLGLAGLGEHPRLFLEGEEQFKTRAGKWDQWCRDNYSGDAQRKCLNPGLACDAIEPWSATGKLCRGITDIGGAIAQAVQSAPKEIAKAQEAFQTVSSTVAAATGQQPPAATKPPATLPNLNLNIARFQQGQPLRTTVTGAGSMIQQAQGQQAGGQSYLPDFTSSSSSLPFGLTPMGAALGAFGLVGVGFAYTMWSRRRA